MLFNHLKIQAPEKPLVGILLNYLLVLPVCFAIAVILAPLWCLHTSMIHTVVELICIFIALAAFFVVWHNYERTSPVNHLVGFGFLMVAVFDIGHLYFYPELNLFPAGYYDLTARYWVLGRLAEALVLLFAALQMYQITINKWLGALITLTVTVGIFVLVLYQPGLLPAMLLPDSGVTPAKIVLEYLIIALFLAGAYIISSKLNDREQLTYRYIFLALLLAVPAEFCFTIFKTLTDSFNILGHALKITYYYYLFRGIFVSAVTWPHARLEAAGKYMTEVLNGIPVGIITYDNNLTATFANKKAEEMLNCQLEDICGRTAKQMFDGYIRNKENNKPLAGRVLAENNMPVISGLFDMEIGDNNRLKTVITSSRLENGGALLQLTEAKKEQELETLQLQTQTIMDSIQDMALLLDKNRRIIMCNGTLEREMQINAKELQGMEIDKFLARTRFKGTVPAVTGKNRENPDASYGEATLVTAGGETREVLFRMAPILNVEDEIIGYICIFSDVTGLKKELQKIRQREKLAMLGQMAAGIVHEIKNPLTAINGFNQLIMGKTTDGKIKDYAGIIQKEVENLNKVVTDFLIFAKPHPPTLREVSVNKMVESLQKILDAQLFNNEVQVDFHLHEQEVPVLADESQLRQVIIIIAKNAIEATQGIVDPRLSIGTHFNQATHEVSISISDNGSGIPSEEQTKLGTPFYTTKDYGTGLGLSICYQIIKEHGGMISLESEPGKGTTFTISLPGLSSD